MPTGRPTPSEVETEWQFDAIDLRPVERWLAEVTPPAAAGSPSEPPLDSLVTASPSTAKRLIDRYLDTSDWRIARAGFVLRVREAPAGLEVTLKDTAPATAGLRRRIEITEPLPAGGIGSLGTEGPVGRRLHALVASRPLLEVLEVRTRRRPYTLRVGADTVAEVALDDTVISVGTGSQPVRLRRVEVEVEAAWVERLGDLVGRMQAQCGLQAATLSKFEAGMLGGGVEIPSATELGPTSVSPSSSIGDVAYVVLRRNLVVMLEHEAGTRLGDDAEDLHDMRVATRRMRAALDLFADMLPVRARHYRVELGWLADALGAVRDLDVQLEGIDSWKSGAVEDDHGALGDLATLIERERDDARRRLLHCLESARYERLVTSMSTMLRQGPSRRSAAARVPAVAVVPDLVRDRHRSVTKAAARVRRSQDAQDFHRLRIRCKRLRYALEFVSEVYPGQTSQYVKKVTSVQDVLGLMQDARVAVERLQGHAASGKPPLSRLTVFVMGGVAERYRAEAARRARRVPKKLEAITGTRWRKLITHMEAKRVESAIRYGRPAPARVQAGAPDPAATEGF
ncbi:MAG TPA: CHAD domain-containing protein [Acidimicrobiales bacterium]|nr:CHAD domain-containing protein [Acidimicrobiales bacterium]